MIFWAKLRTTPDQERMYHAVRVEANPGLNAISESVLHDMGVLDAKSAALLTFISVVIAGLIFSLGLVDYHLRQAPLLRGGIFVYMALFAYAAWIDLRCLYTLGPTAFTPESSGNDFERISLLELSKRRNKYRFALFLCEVGFILLVPFVALWILVADHLVTI